MKVMSSVFLASILTIGSAFANVTVAKEISPAKSCGQCSDELTTGIGRPVLCCRQNWQ